MIKMPSLLVNPWRAYCINNFLGTVWIQIGKMLLANCMVLCRIKEFVLWHE